MQIYKTVLALAVLVFIAGCFGGDVSLPTPNTGEDDNTEPTVETRPDFLLQVNDPSLEIVEETDNAVKSDVKLSFSLYNINPDSTFEGNVPLYFGVRYDNQVLTDAVESVYLGEGSDLFGFQGTATELSVEISSAEYEDICGEDVELLASANTLPEGITRGNFDPVPEADGFTASALETSTQVHEVTTTLRCDETDSTSFSPPVGVKMGDLDEDGDVDTVDKDILQDAILESDSALNSRQEFLANFIYKTNQDIEVSEADFNDLYLYTQQSDNMVSNTVGDVVGDWTGNGVADSSDVSGLQNYLDSEGPTSIYADNFVNDFVAIMDLNRDQIINQEDLSLLQNNI